MVHPQVATSAALATCAAQKQGKFWELEGAIWDKGWANGRMSDISEEAIVKMAAEIGLNTDKLKADMAGNECKELIQKDQAQLAQVGTEPCDPVFGAVPSTTNNLTDYDFSAKVTFPGEW